MGLERVIELAGIYHADGSLLGELRYALGKVTGRAHCALCDITHAGLRRRASFDQALQQLPVPFQLVHLNERTPELVAASQDATPCVLGRTDAGWRLLVGSAALEGCHGDPARLRHAIDRAMDHHHLRFHPEQGPNPPA